MGGPSLALLCSFTISMDWFLTWRTLLFPLPVVGAVTIRTFKLSYNCKFFVTIDSNDCPKSLNEP